MRGPNKSTSTLTKFWAGGTMAANRFGPWRSAVTRASTGRLTGRTVLITGASQGLGRAMALAFVREGADLLLVARREEPLAETRDAVEALGARAVAVSADVGIPDDVDRVAAAALDAFDRVDVLVNNASELGPTPMPYLIDTDPDALRRVIDVNLLGPFLLTRSLLGPMLAAGRGSVINVSSDAGVVGYPGWGAYGVSKAALDQMTRIWASELDGSGVRVNAVDPGDMATAMHAAALPDDDPATLARPEDRTEVFVRLAETTPTGAPLGGSPDPSGGSGQRLEAAGFAPAKA